MKAWYYTFQQALTPMECSWLVKRGTQSLKEGTVGTDATPTVNKSIRDSHVSWLDRNDPELRWLYDRMALLVNEANIKCFHHALFNEPWLAYDNAQFTKYGVGQEYKWHRDSEIVSQRDCDSVRKMSLCIQLSEPSEYEGGTFHMGETPVKDFINQGSAIVFPSWAMHCVEPVTRGVRYSLVHWVFGPPLT